MYLAATRALSVHFWNNPIAKILISQNRDCPIWTIILFFVLAQSSICNVNKLLMYGQSAVFCVSNHTHCKKSRLWLLRAAVFGLAFIESVVRFLPKLGCNDLMYPFD